MARTTIKQKDIERLLDLIKEALTDYIMFPEKGRREEFDVKAHEGDEIFSVSIYRGKVDRYKYNFSARIDVMNEPILELHIGARNRHMNPDGTIIEGNHWHIYSEEYGRGIAFPADELEDEQFVDNTIEYLKKFNVVNYGTINYQFEIV